MSSKSKKTKYPYWQEQANKDKKWRSRRSSGKGQVRMKCSSCGKMKLVFASEVYSRTKPRCPLCGGPLNRPREA